MLEWIISKIRKFDNILTNNKKIQRLFLGIFSIVILIFSYVALNYSKLVNVYNLQKDVSTKLENMKLAVGGEAVGIKLLATGVLVMGVDRTDTELKIGDIILSVNDNKVESNLELNNYIKSSNGENLKLKFVRKGDEFETIISPLKDEISDEYKLGLWVKDSSAGVGTITFYELNSNKFAALGHGVTETKENYILPITSGGITSTTIYSIKKGISKVPR